MNNHRSFITVFLVLTISIIVNAQTADVIETLLRTEAVSNEQAAWFVLLATYESGAYDNYSYEQAFRFATGRQWLPRNARPSDIINHRDVSFLIMQAFNISGGPMYAIFRNSHYAYREMLQNEIIQGRTAPMMDVTGETLLFMVGKILFNLDENPWELPQKPPEPEIPTAPEEIIIVREPQPIIPQPVVEEPESEPEIIYSGSTLAERLKWLESSAEDGGSYVFEVYADESIAPHFLYYGGKTVSVTISGDSAERIVSLSTAGSIFNIGSGVTLILGNNIIISGRRDNTESLIIVSSGNLIINSGAVITGNKASYGGGVHFMGGTFTMNGGTISGNNALYGSGVYIGYGRTFTMNGGVISGNTAFYGGGVYVSSNGTLNKTGGVLYIAIEDFISTKTYCLVTVSNSGITYKFENL